MTYRERLEREIDQLNAIIGMDMTALRSPFISEFDKEWLRRAIRERRDRRKRLTRQARRARVLSPGAP